MSANFTVQSAVSNNGILKVHLSRDVDGQQEDIWLNVLPKTFGETFMEGDLRGAEFPLVNRKGSNGKR